MGSSSILFPCWFVLILFGPVVYGENSRNGALPKLNEAMNGEMRSLESFSGRKFASNHRFSTRKELVSVMASRGMEERGVLVQRRLLAENTTKDESPLLQKTETKKAEDETEKGKKLQIQATSSKGTEEIGQNPTKPENGSVIEISVMETIHHDHSTLGGKDNNAERSEAKVEKLQDGEKISSVQKPLKNRTEQNTNSGSESTTKDESPLLQKTGIKKAEDDTDQGKKLQIHAASSKRAEEISQTSKKREDGSAKEIPVMETIHPDHSTMGGKDNNVERSEAKAEKLQDGEKGNSVQKPLENRTEQNNNNGIVNATKDESPMLQKAETKNTEVETEHGKKIQIETASSEKREEISQNPTKPEDVLVKEITAVETIHPDHSTLGGKDSNAEISEAKKEKLQDAEKVNSVQKPLHNRTEQNTQHGEENIGNEPAKDTKEITEAESLPSTTEAQKQERQNTPNSANTGLGDTERNEAETHANSAEIQSIGSGTAANSTGMGVQKIESEEARNLTDSTHLQIQNTTDEVQKEEGIEVEAIAKSSVNKMEQMENTEIKSLANSSEAEMPEKAKNLTSFADNETQKMQSRESSVNSTDDEKEKMESSEAEALSNSIDNNIQQAETLEDSTEKAESSEDSTDAEAQRTESIEELSANSLDTMASKEFEDSTNSTATEMPWTAQNSSNNKDVEIHGPEDEYNDLIQEFADLPSKFHDTAEKVADQLMPGIQKLSNRSKSYFSRANEEIAHGFRPLVGHHYAPFVASGVSCIFLLLPVLVAIVVFEQVRVFFPLQKVILLANIYLANYFATLVFTSFIIGMEPLEFFYKKSLSGYIYLQLLQGLGFLLYLSMQCFNVVATCSNRTILLAKLGSFVQLSVAVCIGLHYYVTVFHRAIAQKPPRTCWRVHGVYSLLFGILCLISRIRHGKKEYVQAADYNTNKKN